MKEHIYIAKKSRIFEQSFLIWLIAALQIFLNIITIPAFIRHNQAWAIVFINGLFSVLTIPSIIIFLKYYKNSVGKRFIVAYDSLKFIDDKTGKVILLRNSDIVNIHLIQNIQTSRLPWCFHEYFSFIDDKGNKIIVTSYIMSISDFWLDTLARKVSSKKLTREEKAYPIF